MNHPALPPDTRIGTVHLRVGDLHRQVAFYQDVLGFLLLAEDGATAVLGAAVGRPLLVLHGSPGAPPRGQGTTGLFHAAFRVPSRADLAATILRIREHHGALEGFADHNVSEAAYLTDPEGNGIEIYVDRVRDVWHGVDGSIFMTTEPLDLPGLLLAAEGPAPRLPAETVVGHVHLRVSSVEASEAFYSGFLGFEVTSRSYPGALFVAAGGYHHHLGFNVWGERSVSLPEEGSLGLMSFDIVVPSSEARRRILKGAEEGTLHDPDHIGVRIARP